MLRILSAKEKELSMKVKLEKPIRCFGSQKEEDQMHGFTNNYIKITAPYDADKVNTLQKVYMAEIDRTGTMAVKELKKHEFSPIT